MGTVTVNSVTINNSAGVPSYGPFYNKPFITSVDLQYVSWTNNSMDRAFYYCPNLTNVTNINKNIVNMTQTFYYCTNLVTAPIIPNSVTKMYETFAGCTNLVNPPVIPNNVRTIEGIFSHCHNLTNIPPIPNSVTGMSSAFNACYNLITPPIIPASIINMTQTFWNCRNLTSAPAIPSSVVNMYMTFQNCQNLIGDIYIYGLNIISAYSCFGDTALPKNVYIPFNTDLGIFTNTYNSFNNAGYNTSVIRNGVTIKENPAFETYGDWWWCNYDGAIYKYLGTSTAITIPNNINGITTDLKTTFNGSNIVSLDFNKIATKNLYRVCNNCRSLTTVTNFPDNIVDLSYAFYWCANLTSVPTIPSSVLHMNYTFSSSGKTSGTSISFNIPPNLIDAQGLCIGFKSLTTAPTLPESVVNLFEGFASCNSLVTAPIIPKNVKNIANAFYGCKSLTGNLYIKSNQIINAVSCFYDLQGQQLRKNVYIPFKNSDGSWSATYNSFIAAGYKTDGSFHNAYLMNYTDLYSEY